ncbi:hypothetical protein TSUD_283360 [Trifolium subterraneum]|uniref:Uncharacterized protein n=1 Tax=Trifolium subterraneum TaxID=3900 RepID=A0A2Z6PCV4_TRISU|nr:hypothetical protein TSUD_283360 [Trifolium subterraneum]
MDSLFVVKSSWVCSDQTRMMLLGSSSRDNFFICNEGEGFRQCSFINLARMRFLGLSLSDKCDNKGFSVKGQFEH